MLPAAAPSGHDAPLLVLKGGSLSPLYLLAACSTCLLAAAGGHCLLPNSSDEFSGCDSVLCHMEPVQR